MDLSVRKMSVQNLMELFGNLLDSKNLATKSIWK